MSNLTVKGNKKQSSGLGRGMGGKEKIFFLRSRKRVACFYADRNSLLDH